MKMMKVVYWLKLSIDESCLLMKVDYWWKLSIGEGCLLMKVVYWWKLSIDDSCLLKNTQKTELFQLGLLSSWHVDYICFIFVSYLISYLEGWLRLLGLPLSWLCWFSMQIILIHFWIIFVSYFNSYLEGWLLTTG